MRGCRWGRRGWEGSASAGGGGVPCLGLGLAQRLRVAEVVAGGAVPRPGNAPARGLAHPAAGGGRLRLGVVGDVWVDIVPVAEGVGVLSAHIRRRGGSCGRCEAHRRHRRRREGSNRRPVACHVERRVGGLTGTAVDVSLLYASHAYRSSGNTSKTLLVPDMCRRIA